MTNKERKDEYEYIKGKALTNNIEVHVALERLSHLGYAPNLLYDNAGHWAVVVDGFQNVVMDEPEDVNMHFYVQKHRWGKTPVEALKLFFTEKDEDITPEEGEDIEEWFKNYLKKR